MAAVEADPSVEVWRITAPETTPLGHLGALLDAEEKERMDRYRRPDDRQRHLAAHGGLRLLLGRRLGLAPSAVRLGRADCPLCGGPHGRPVVVGAPGAPELSVAHAEGMVLLALAADAVGVDVEPAARASVAGELGSTLHPVERAIVDGLPTERRDRAVLTCFVRTEAYLKGLGTGLGLDPASVAIGPAGTAAGGRLGVEGWDVLDLSVGPGHVAAIAVTGRDVGSPVPVVADLDLSLT